VAVLFEVVSVAVALEILERRDLAPRPFRSRRTNTTAAAEWHVIPFEAPLRPAYARRALPE
jgi:hypothetical protein